MEKPTLLVLAAGMGSRYGSLKQMDGVGPNNEAIIDYSVYDAVRAGFGTHHPLSDLPWYLLSTRSSTTAPVT